jgi:D-glycero-alpha-D-manno-heptose-7-phosphate kinase
VVISRTPLRVSFVGGGSDIVSFAERNGGAVVSTAIDKYVYVVVTARFEGNIRVSYTKTEIVREIGQLKHELVREAMRLAGLPHGVEIVTIADVPSRGTGLGSSSAVTVGTLNALYAFQGILKSPDALAEDAAEIEIDVLGKPIGKQDHYASAVGGLQLLRFGPGESVQREPIVLTDEGKAHLQRNLIMFFTGRQRSASKVLNEIDPGSSAATRRNLGRLRDLALELHQELGRGDPDVLGEYLHRGWEYKRRLAGVSDPKIDAWYAAARKAGALGGKLLGAGGGGFLLLIAPPWRHRSIREALGRPRELAFRIARHGSRNIFIQP